MRLKRWGAIALAAVTAAGMLGGCSRLENKTEAETVAATFGNEDIMMDYVMFQMRTSQYGYEQLFGAMYGTTDFWHQEYAQGVTIEAFVIDSVMTSIRQTKVLCNYAQKNGIVLTAEQQEKVNEAIAEALETADEEYAELIGMTEELIRQSYQENALANLAYMNLVADVDTTIGEDEFIRKDISYVKLTPTDLEENSSEAVTEAATIEASSEETSELAEETEAESHEDSESETIATDDLAEEEETTEEAVDAEAAEEIQKEKLADAADEIEELLADGEEPADIITEYNGDTTWFTATQSSVTIGADSVYDYTEIAYALSEGETALYSDEETGVIYVLLCTSDNNEEARQDAIDTEIENRKAALFAEKYVSVQDASPKFTVDTDVIATINFHTPLYVPETEAETTEAELETEEETTAEVLETEGETAEPEVETEGETEAE